MSLAIQRGAIEAVLIAGEWHPVKKGSFWWDAFEVIEGDPASDSFTPGVDIAQGAEALGFGFELPDDRGAIFGPWSSIQAIRTLT